MPLTPNNREEHWLQGMVDGQTTLEPNKRREYWYKEIVDAIGSGGGGGGGVLVVNDVSGTLDKTWKEISDAFDDGVFVYVFTESEGFFIKALVPVIVTNNANIYGVGANNCQYVASTENDYPVLQ